MLHLDTFCCLELLFLWNLLIWIVLLASQSSTVSSSTTASTRRVEGDSAVSGGVAGIASAASAARGVFHRQGSQSQSTTGIGGEDTDDTMKNLRKTFAGIFGDM